MNSGAESPATPTHDDNYDLLTSLVWGSARSLSSSAETLVSPISAHPVQHEERREQVINQILERKHQQPVKVEFKICLTENTHTQWEAVVQGSSLYLRLPGVLSSGSKESFMVLLDFAQEKLACNNCIVCVRKSRSDRAIVLRTFMFLGFQLIPPNSNLLPSELKHPDYVFMHYNME